MKFVILFLFICCSQIAVAGECSVGSHWVRAYHRRAYYRGDGTLVAATNVSAHCQRNPEGYDFWKDKIKSDIPSFWPNKTEKIKSWSQEEIERVLEALSVIPQELWGVYIKEIYRFDKSKVYPNPASSLNGTIALYDTAFNSSPDPSLARLITHELAHEKYQHLGDKDQELYQMATNWSNFKGNWTTRRTNDDFIRPDGKIGPEEDFAVNIDTYLFNPDLLKKRVPHAYTWIKEHFSDKFVVRKGDKK